VMNDNPTVDPAIAERVRQAAAGLSYAASPLARSLVLGRTHTVAVLVPDLSNPMFQAVLRGVTRAAAGNEYRVLVADSIETASTELVLARDLRRRCDAIVLCAPRMPDDELVAIVPELTPIVIINRDHPRIQAPVLTADYEAGIQLLAHHLYDLGHRRLAYLQGNPDSASNRQRLAGLRTFTAERTDVELTVIRCGVSFEQGHAAAEAVLHSAVTGVLAYNDLVAMGLLSGVSRRGVDVPGRLSVCGFDDIPFAPYTTPPLTTASVPAGELGAQAWHRIHALVEGNEPDYDINFRPKIEVRGSTGPANPV
jgi:LacI family transcriptional regulator